MEIKFYMMTILWKSITRLMRFKVLSCLLITILFMWFRNLVINYKDVDRTLLRSQIDNMIKSKTSNLSCKQPTLPVHSPEMMKFVNYVPNINCSDSGFNWVKCHGSECVIQELAKFEYGPIRCLFKDVVRVGDFHVTEGRNTSSDDIYRLEKTDVNLNGHEIAQLLSNLTQLVSLMVREIAIHAAPKTDSLYKQVRVYCKTEQKAWSTTLTGIRMDNHIWDTTTFDMLGDTALKMNVLMFGFDSISRNTFIRKLPKSYKYMTETLKTIVLQGYNIVGDGTLQALIPILTGKTELELPDTRKRLKNTKFVNSYPFIWNSFKDAGYVTGFFEDLPRQGTFTYRLNGFKEPPTDHYMRPYYLAILKEEKKWPKFCTGETPRHKVMMNAVKDFFTVYKTKPMFLFAFHGDLSHNNFNLVGVADDDLLEMLRDLHDSGALNNTILIVMSNHGPRFAKIRATVQGALEERLPFFSFTFPPWFKEKHVQAYRNFKENQHKLTTPFDIFRTLQSVLDLEDGLGDINQRSISLFSKIPAERSCADAYIEPHWCACLDWHKIPITDHIVERLGETLVKTLNGYTEAHRDICEPLSISRIVWAMRLTPNKNALKYYKRPLDIDGFIPNLAEEMESDTDTYQIQAILLPGNSLFEASFSHSKRDDSLYLKISDISRINMYGSQARCVEKNLPHLRKYCYCWDV